MSGATAGYQSCVLGLELAPLEVGMICPVVPKTPGAAKWMTGIKTMMASEHRAHLALDVSRRSATIGANAAVFLRRQVSRQDQPDDHQVAKPDSHGALRATGVLRTATRSSACSPSKPVLRGSTDNRLRAIDGWPGDLCDRAQKRRGPRVEHWCRFVIGI